MTSPKNIKCPPLGVLYSKLSVTIHTRLMTSESDTDVERPIQILKGGESRFPDNRLGTNGGLEGCCEIKFLW